jgi:hypothetical protein
MEERPIPKFLHLTKNITKVVFLFYEHCSPVLFLKF